MFGFTKAEDDGIFFISFDDFIKHFRSFEILKFKDNYETIASHKISKKEANKIQIIFFSIKKKKVAKEANKKVKEKIKVFINLYQKNPRIRRKNNKKKNTFPRTCQSFSHISR